jgi:hypothetical protein
VGNEFAPSLRTSRHFDRRRRLTKLTITQARLGVPRCPPGSIGIVMVGGIDLMVDDDDDMVMRTQH